jgi:uncharacterized Zn-binding protein involved in type VI secretion
VPDSPQLPAARKDDFHACTQQTPKPHIGGPVVDGFGGVLVEGRKSARLGDPTECKPVPELGPDFIKCGSKTVLIGGRPAARLSSKTIHGGFVASGSPKVLIGGPDACLSDQLAKNLQEIAKLKGKIAENEAEIKWRQENLKQMDRPDTPEDRLKKALEKALAPKEEGVPPQAGEQAERDGEQIARDMMQQDIARRQAENQGLRDRIGQLQGQNDGLRNQW